ncbi:Gfo/Idh/MocA family protein [Rubritalea tangerina]|uniref:Gfo/Idh/MocA family protein n=1 Tax=Rubritalea tangerina TaxID=430798 RepID=A0ABW4ZDH0_9BACT
METKNRRNFLKMMGVAGAALSSTSIASAQGNRPSGSKYMGDFVAPKLDKVKVAIIGCGARGGTHYAHLPAIEGTEIVALCDLYQDLAERAKKKVLAADAERHKNVKLYTGDKHAYKKMLAETKPDLVYVVTPWEWHAPMAIDSMNAGAHVCVEVPLCVTVKEAWDIIDVSEKTGKHCMMLENVNYGRDELLYLNMCRQGIFGELLHGEAAYIHELRGQMNQVERGTGSWRTPHYANRNGNLYPTHGLGPVAQYMNLSRGDDNFGRISSFSSPALGRKLAAQKNFPADHKWNKLDWKGGDLSTSIIKTVLGRTLMVQWDETSPRPYSRHNLIQGTKGCGAGFPTRVALDYEKGDLPEDVFKVMAGNKKHTNYHRWTQGDQLQALYEAWDHPLYKRMAADAKRMGGHGGMDFIMNFRVIECLRKGEPLDQNVYEGAYWSAVGPLSEASVAQDGTSVAFPDFTRGNWKKTKPLPIVS